MTGRCEWTELIAFIVNVKSDETPVEEMLWLVLGGMAETDVESC